MRRHLTAILLLLSATFRHFLRRQMHRLRLVPPACTTLEPVPPCTPGVASAAQAEIGRNVNVEPIVGQVFDIHRASDGHLYVSDASAHPSSYSIRPAELGQIPELTFDAEGRVYNLSYRGFAQSLMEAVGGRSGVRVRGQVALTRWNVDDGDWTVLAQVPGIEVRFQNGLVDAPFARRPLWAPDGRQPSSSGAMRGVPRCDRGAFQPSSMG